MSGFVTDDIGLQRRRLAELHKALNVLRTPEGHATGAFGYVAELMPITCPMAYAEEQRANGDSLVPKGERP